MPLVPSRCGGRLCGPTRSVSTSSASSWRWRGRRVGYVLPPPGSARCGGRMAPDSIRRVVGAARRRLLAAGLARRVVGWVGVAAAVGAALAAVARHWVVEWRSEEHTSELQSRENLVCRLLLEKKQARPQRWLSG